MQWNLVTNSSNPADYPEPGEQVLGLWLGGFWKKIIYSPDEGWYTARDGVEQSAPTWWGRVDTAVSQQLPPQGEVGPKGEEGPLGPDASVMERVRKFLEQLIEVRDIYSADLELKLPPEYCGKYECYDDWAADGAAALLQAMSLADNAEAVRDLQTCTERIAQFKREHVTKFSIVERLREATEKAKQAPVGPAAVELQDALEEVLRLARLAELPEEPSQAAACDIVETFMCSLSDAPQAASTTPAQPPLALDVSLEKARALHRVWRALNDGDCPRCHRFHAATEIMRSSHAIACPACLFRVTRTEIEAIEKMFAPAMDAAVAIFDAWRDENNNKQEKTDAVDRDNR